MSVDVQAPSHAELHTASRRPGWPHPRMTFIGGPEPARVFGFVVDDSSRRYYTRYIYEVVLGKKLDDLPPEDFEAAIASNSRRANRLLPTYLGAARPSLPRVRNQLIPVYADRGLKYIFVLKDSATKHLMHSEEDVNFVRNFLDIPHAVEPEWYEVASELWPKNACEQILLVSSVCAGPIVHLMKSPIRSPAYRVVRPSPRQEQ